MMTFAEMMLDRRGNVGQVELGKGAFILATVSS